MQVDKQMGLFLAVALLLLLSGCSSPQQQAGVIGTSLRGNPQPDNSLRGSSSGSVDSQGSSIVKRFQDAAPQSRTAVESAMELLEKHTELSRQAAELERTNQGLITENNQFKARVTSLESELEQAQKELAEANDLLVEMRLELNNWKTSVLGFRDEMRQADIAQLEALLKVLKILGGEVDVQSAQGQGSEDTTATGKSPHQPGQAKAQEAPTPGGANG